MPESIPVFLADIVANSHARAAALRADPDLRARAEAAEAPRLSLAGPDLIAEVKLRSPSLGTLASGGSEEVVRRALTYARHGATAVSVLTEPSRFGGSLAHLAAVAAALRPLGVPVLAKDFLVDPVQVLAAKAAGAGAVLLVARIVDDPQLQALLTTAEELDLPVLLEAFDAAELERCARFQSDRVVLGLNCRDLDTMQLVPERHLSHRGAATVAESGLRTPEDFEARITAGYRAALVGSALMGTADPGGLLRRMLHAARPTPSAPQPLSGTGPLVKVCGLRTEAGVDAAVRAGADAVGFVLTDSPREVAPARARALARRLPPQIRAVGVFRRVDAQALCRARVAGMSVVQGRMDEAIARRARDLGLQPLPVVPDGPELALRIAQTSRLAPLVLVDGVRPGSGRLTDHARIAAARRGRPVLLAGGLHPDNVAPALHTTGAVGVDASSGLELSRGIKDLDLIASFITNARAKRAVRSAS